MVSVVTPERADTGTGWANGSVTWFRWAGGDRPIVSLKPTAPGGLYRTASLLRQGERALRRVLVEEQADACLALWAVPSGFLAWRTCPSLGIPYSVWALGSDIHTWGRYPVAGRLIARILRNAHGRFADGLGLADEVRRLSGRECDFLPTTRRLPAGTERRRKAGEPVSFVYVGRLELVKGPDLLVEAMALLKRRGVPARLTMIGGGTLGGRLAAEVKTGGLSGVVTMLPGGVPALELARLMSGGDCLVIPSRQESIPVVFSEALQLGTPLLVTDAGDMGRLARDHGLADPVPIGDAPALARAMEAFASGPQEHRASYLRARRSLLELFDTGRAVDRYLASIAAPVR